MSMSRGGRSYRMVVDNPESKEEVSPVRRRNKPIGGGVSYQKNKRSLTKSGRRVSCLDLGEGTYQGWLRTRKPARSKWEECHKWCVLKDADLYVYASKMDTTASSKIHLPMFHASEAKETKKSGAFKVHNSGTTFYFRSKTDEEKYEWINHLSLAAIQYQSSPASSGVDSSGVDSSYSTGTSQGYSDENETDSSSVCDDVSQVTLRTSKCKSSSSNIYTSAKLKTHLEGNKDLRRMVTSIRDADLDLIGADRETRRQSQLRKSLAHATVTRKNSMRNKKLGALRRKQALLQGLEQELTDISALLDQPTHSNLEEFLSRYHGYQDELHVDQGELHSESSFDADESSSARSSNDADHMLTSIDSTQTVRPIDVEVSSITSSGPSDRHTLTPETLSELENLSLGQRQAACPSPSRLAKDSVFSKKKFKQTQTSL
ncbi:interactor protein for cytohesin exchange factors 1-like [Watersipora subatra]|uniref:interactor protein for cytohesin exchange factors 1-like n=1 Tax=Watersipora subatra TaxID=2589382 RepID=UPI00355B3947